MTIDLGTPAAAGLGGVVHALRDWQDDDAPLQLHPGDVGWFWRFGAEATAAAVRTWSRDGRVLAAGLLDGSTVLRLAIAPDAQHDEELAHQLVADIVRPERGVLPDGEASVEAPRGSLVRDRLAEQGWQEGEPWTPLHRNLSGAVPDPGLRVEVVGPDLAHVRVAVQRAAFDRSTFTEERWHAMASGLPYADARCLVAFDGGDAVAAATVWSAGPGRPGLIEPLGVHRDHRGHGLGTAVTVAAAATLRELGASSVAVCTPSANVGGVATYEAAGLERGAAVPDLCRKG